MQRVRTLLFVPGDRPDRITKAVESGADGVVVDLEDAVAESRKSAARRQAVEAIVGLGPPAAVLMLRVNGIRTSHFADDVAGLVPVLERLHAVVLPMCESADDVRVLDAALADAEGAAGVEAGATRVLPIVETAAGVGAAREIAGASARVLTLLFGAADLSHELAVSPTAQGEELATARSLVVLAAAAAKVGVPLDGPYLTLDDDAGLATSSRTARRLGFGGKAVIHPAQLPVVRATFAPTAAELAWAAEVDTAFTRAEAEGRSSVRLADGTFVDYPIAFRARSMLAESTSRGEST